MLCVPRIPVASRVNCTAGDILSPISLFRCLGAAGRLATILARKMLTMCVGKTADAGPAPTSAYHHHHLHHHHHHHHHQPSGSQKLSRWGKTAAGMTAVAAGKTQPQPVPRGTGHRLEERVLHREEAKERQVVRDDEEGHLVYRNGDILDKRCNHSSLLMLLLQPFFFSVCLSVCVRVCACVCVACMPV